MNVYGFIPANCFPSHSTLTYWAQAASLAGLANCEPTLTSTGLVLGPKKSQLTTSEVIHKNRGALSPSCSDELSAMFHITPRVTSYSVDHVASLTHHGSLEQLHAHLHHQQQQLRKHHQNHKQQHHVFTASPPLGSGLAPLQALCQSDVSVFSAKSSTASDSLGSLGEARGSLKFGISRILSDDFGKSRCEKENNFLLSSVPESCRSLTLCPCNSVACSAYTTPPSQYHKGSLPSLSAVHALQPPTYPLSSSADALPGPYSILSTDNAFPNQPKRKRSWSRAVFSNLQRKGLEKRFEVQKYVTKPDRRQLAAMLGLTDAQVKVWFQNRRMKWRHAQQQGEKDKQIQQPEQGSELTKQDSGSSQLTAADDSSSHAHKAGDVTETAETSRDWSALIGHSPERDTSYSDGVKAATVHCLSAREEECTSPQDLRVRLYVSECPPSGRFGLIPSLDFRTEQGVDTSCSYARAHDVAQALDNNVIVGLSRHPVRSPTDDDASSDLLEHHLGLSDSSPPDLEINSDLDVNDTDVDMNDSDVDMNDADVDMNDTRVDKNDTGDNMREIMVNSRAIIVSDLRLDKSS